MGWGRTQVMTAPVNGSGGRLLLQRAITLSTELIDEGSVCWSSLWQAPRAASMTQSKALKSLAGS